MKGLDMGAQEPVAVLDSYKPPKDLSQVAGHTIQFHPCQDCQDLMLCGAWLRMSALKPQLKLLHSSCAKQAFFCSR